LHLRQQQRLPILISPAIAILTAKLIVVLVRIALIARLRWRLPDMGTKSGKKIRVD
jgi:hypothetical protein